MKQDEQIEIALSKKKMVLTLFGAIVFIIIGIWLLTKSPKISNPLFGNPTFILITGIVAVLFFGSIAVTIYRKLSDKKPGLIINRQGIIDNSSGVSAGLIPWSDIQEIKIVKVANQKFIMIIVKNPQDYLDSVTNPLKRNAMKANFKFYGSPISISSGSLQTNLNNLYQLLIEKMIEYKL